MMCLLFCSFVYCNSTRVLRGGFLQRRKEEDEEEKERRKKKKRKKKRRRRRRNGKGGKEYEGKQKTMGGRARTR
jgi:hypothetical protein